MLCATSLTRSRSQLFLLLKHKPSLFLQVLVLSGEEECTDMETKSLFTAITNIIEEEVTQPFSYFEFIFLFQSLAQFLEMQSLVPLSNFSLRVTLFSHLQKLVYKEPNLKELIVKEVKRLEPRIILYF